MLVVKEDTGVSHYICSKCLKAFEDDLAQAKAHAIKSGHDVEEWTLTGFVRK